MTMLMSAASATPNSSTSSLLQAGRSRLVAKTTSSLQQKAKAFKPVAPDPMQVWNKNRLQPAQSTKHLTDEELKQQYGIHLTSRLQADGDAKEAKWADIDDDEDDWAPETIEWNDGTKTTLAALEAMPAEAQPQPSDVARPYLPPQAESSKSRPPQILSSVGPNATVLRLGASAERQLAQRAAADMARKSMERPRTSFTNTTPAPAPSKSPWAALPAVDKLSPIEINPQPMGPPSRFANNLVHPGPSAMMQAPSPAKEISADDFNRAWRDSSSSQPRELFMPNSGRYEAVPEGRRRMSKNEHNYRAPAVLQRPSQSDVNGPAEPSAAFQTNRTSSDARRRASSTISGTSGQLARRLSMKSGDMPPPVFDSQPEDIDGRPVSQDGPPAQLQTPISEARGPQIDSVAPVAISQADAEAQYKAQMKEAAARARQKRNEEEMRLETEKKERLKKLIADLETKEAEKKAQQVVPTQAETVISTDAAIPLDEDQDPIKPSVSMPSASQSPPKPPQPLATGKPQQYGMMKVHPLDAAQRLGINGAHSTSQIPPRAVDNVSKDITDESQRSVQPLPNGVRPGSQGPQRPFTESLAPPEASPKMSKPASAGSDARSGWGDIRDHRSAPSNNLWGISSNKALGNGTFDHGLAGYAPQDLSRTSSTAQGWTGRTPTSGRSPQPHYANHQSPDAGSHVQPDLISPEPTPLAADSEVDSLFPVVRPAPIGPPQQQAQALSNGASRTSHVNGNVAAWNNFHQVAGQQERVENERFQRELDARKAEELRTGVRQGPGYTFNETWMQVNLGDQADQRQLANVHQTAIPASATFGAVGTGADSSKSPRMANGQPTRGSRFFPAQANGYQQQDRRAVTYSHPQVPRSPSPPPAEEYASQHPAFDGDYSRPAVRFPREKAVVKLPPIATPASPPPISASTSTQAEQPLTWAARVSMPAPTPQPQQRSVSTPIAQSSMWQERFNGLLGKKREALQAVPSPVAISSREPMDVISPDLSASVSLPQQAPVPTLAKPDTLVLKTVEEEENLFEDRQLGSLPTVKLQGINLVNLPLAPAPRQFPSRLETESRGRYNADAPDYRHWHGPKPPQHFALIRLPGASTSIRKDLAIRQASAPAGIQKNRNMSTGYRGGFRGSYRGAKLRQASKAR